MEPPQQAVHANHGQGRHAFQLANTIKSNPLHKEATADLSIPVFLPDNAMAPPQKSNNKVSWIFISGSLHSNCIVSEERPIVNATNAQSLSQFTWNALPQAGAPNLMLQMAAPGFQFGSPASTWSQNPGLNL